MAELRIEALLDEVIHRKASDLHLQVGRPPILRIYGELIPQTDYEPADRRGCRGDRFCDFGRGPEKAANHQPRG